MEAEGTAGGRGGARDPRGVQVAGPSRVLSVDLLGRPPRRLYWGGEACCFLVAIAEGLPRTSDLGEGNLGKTGAASLVNECGNARRFSRARLGYGVCIGAADAGSGTHPCAQETRRKKETMGREEGHRSCGSTPSPRPPSPAPFHEARFLSPPPACLKRLLTEAAEIYSQIRSRFHGSQLGNGASLGVEERPEANKCVWVRERGARLLWIPVLIATTGILRNR